MGRLNQAPSLQARSCFDANSSIFRSFLVAIPAIAQRVVDDTDLPIYSAEILDPTPSSVSFVLHTSLKIPLGLRIRINAFNLSLFNRDVQPMTPYITVKLPSYSLKGHTAMTIEQHNTLILNESQFLDTLTDAVYQERFTMSAKGSTVGHLGALNAPLTLNKDIELNGLDKLDGFSIESAEVAIPKEADGTNIIATATLPNRSVFTFALGNVTLNLWSYDLLIGQGTIQNVVLKPGNNTVSLRGELDIETIIDNIYDIIHSQEAALLDGDFQLSASGNSTIYNGNHIAYYEEILNNLTLTTRVSILEVLSGTLDGLLDDHSNSTIASLVQNITNTLSDLTSSKDISKAADSLKGFI
ncbi:uncharacterized protein N7483_009924 [Penicillium malachiteum]|uniref:uncharacterized protein n=1 Tax=Penicillium malachiteum TaxID=1324776 RepID=UPI002546EBD8|nr:uncharacterized protein N7483_009924 [Penicillium malachiteum]KAJ5718842.1 hypothetical protein N7483_009924 [Penicillium malachiteum]